MSPARRQQLGPQLVRNTELEIEWREYPRIEPGTYPAYCKWAKRYRDPAFRRWTCLQRWDVLKDDLLTVIATIPCWLPLGTREKPWASRRGKYLREWVRANGGPPEKRDPLSPRVFVRRMARVEVADTTRTKALFRTPWFARSLIGKQGRFRVIQSASHTVKEGTDESETTHKLTANECQEMREPISALAGVEGVNHSSTHPRAGRVQRPVPQRQVWNNYSG